MFGKDGFEDALKKIAAIEQAFGLGDLNALTPPPPTGPVCGRRQTVPLSLAIAG